MKNDKNKELKDKYIEYYRQVPILKYAAMSIGQSRQTIYNWLKVDLTFLTRAKEARADWVAKKVGKVKPEFALERMEKKIFGERVEHLVKLPKPILGGDSAIHSNKGDQKVIEAKKEDQGSLRGNSSQ